MYNFFQLQYNLKVLFHHNICNFNKKQTKKQKSFIIYQPFYGYLVYIGGSLILSEMSESTPNILHMLFHGIIDILPDPAHDIFILTKIISNG